MELVVPILVFQQTLFGLGLASVRRAGTTCPAQTGLGVQAKQREHVQSGCFHNATAQRGCRLRRAGHMALISLMSSLLFGSLCFLLSDHIAAAFVLSQCKFPPF